MFSKVLVANRGEIAIRIFRTLRELGIKSVAVYSEADANAPHVWAADEAYLIGPAPATESYLVIEKIIEVATKSGAEAIHPGYGFLAENPRFAEAAQKASLVFIGPSPDAMSAMGDKSEARLIAEEAGVPTTPGSAAMEDDEEIAKTAREIGMPVLLKAAAGGGGKGMRLVEDESDLEEAIGAARREAQASFGDGRMLVEKYIHPARHIEVQVIADSHGNTIALGERECSLQRRHQKIIEEAPSPVVDSKLRESLQEAACKLAEAVNYTNAGTVEFLLGPDNSFYFMEMNARLQVEHPVTELVTGLDLVRLQLEIAAGEKLAITQKDAILRGHAIEARLYAEDPDREFLPMTGKILKLNWPEVPGYRVDSGIQENQEIHASYDPMLAKLIAWGPDREQARIKLLESMRQSAILGVVTNRDYLIELIKSGFYCDGETFTHTIDELMADRKPNSLSSEMLLAAAVAWSGGYTQKPAQGVLREADPHSPWKLLGGWRQFG